MIIIGPILVGIIFFGELYLKNRVDKYKNAKGRQENEKEKLGGLIILKKYHNYGAFLNMGENRRKLVLGLSVVISVILTGVFVLSFGTRGNTLLRLGLSLLLGGAYSNTYDRLKRKYVVDYVSFGVKWKPLRSIVFNISDFCIMIGAFLAVLGEPR